MNRAKVVLFMITLIIMFLYLSSVLAQSSLDATFTSPNGDWQFNYPSTWTVNYDEQTGIATVSAEDLSVMLVSPAALEQAGLNADDGLETLLANLVGDEGREGTSMVMIFSDGTAAFVHINPSTTDETANTVAAEIANSFDAITTTETSNTATSSIPGYNEDWQTVVAQMRSQGLITGGGSLVFDEDRAYYTGTGSRFAPLASYQPFPDVIMAGELNFTPGAANNLETCGLMARIVLNARGSTERYLEFGIDSDKDLYFYDYDPSGVYNFYEYQQATDYNFDRPLHFLAIIQEDRLDIYVDGNLIFDVDGLEARQGIYGLSLYGKTPATRCEGRNIWVYRLDFEEDGTCRVSAATPVNMRDDPSLQGDIKGQVTSGIIFTAIAQAQDSSGYVWWQLENEYWVREDVVHTEGACLTLPKGD